MQAFVSQSSCWRVTQELLGQVSPNLMEGQEKNTFFGADLLHTLASFRGFTGEQSSVELLTEAYCHGTSSR